MLGNTVRFIFLYCICCAGVANAQAVPVGAKNARGAAWIKVDLADDTSVALHRLKILAQNIEDTAPNVAAVGHHREGIGAAGAQASSPAVKAETGYDLVRNRSELIIILFDQAVTEADVDVTYFSRNEEVYAGTAYHERGGWRAWRNNVKIAEGFFLPSREGGGRQIVISARQPFDRLEMFATPYVADSGAEIQPGAIITDSSDFLIRHIVYRPETARVATAGN